jgi:dihydrofolate reductase
MDRINRLKKLVASKTLRECFWNATLVSGDVSTELRIIKRQSGGDIIKYGITQLDKTLLASGLIDQYHLWIMPFSIGPGKRAFADVDPTS